MVPILGWLPRYERRWLRGDMLAGIAVTAMIVPKDLGYAGIAGVPVQNGLYAAAAGAILYALFCTSRQISTGPSSSLAAVAGSAVLATGLGGEQAAQLVAAIALVTGVLFLLLGVFRMGWISQFLSKAVVTGFLAGAAVQVVIGELPKLTGTSADGDSSWRELASWIRGLGDIHWTTLLVGIVSLAVILGLRFAAPKVPGALVLVVGGLVASHLFDLGAHGVALVGPVPRGLPAPQLPALDLFTQHLPQIAIASVALLLIGFSQTAGDARVFATRHRYRIDVNQESFAQGMANLGAGVFQGMPVSTSLSASSLNESSGATTPVASLTTGVLVLATLVFLAPLFSDLPKAVLGGDHHRRRRVRDDRHPGAAPPASRCPIRLLDRGCRNPRGALGRRAHRRRDRDRALARMARVRRDPSPDPAPRPRSRDAGIPHPRRVPRRRDLPGHRGPSPRRRPLLRHCRSARRPHPRTHGPGPATPRARARPRRRQLHRLAGRREADRDPGPRRARNSRYASPACKPHVLAMLQSEGVLDRIGADHLHGNVHRAVEAQLAETSERSGGATTEKRRAGSTLRRALVHETEHCLQGGRPVG